MIIHTRHLWHEHCVGCGGDWPCRTVLLDELETLRASVVDSALLTAEAVRVRLDLERQLETAMGALAQAEADLLAHRYGGRR